MEASDKLIRQILNERNLKNVEKDVSIIRMAQNVVLEKLAKKEKNIFLTNSIEENIYPTVDRDYYSNENTFYCQKQNKILYFSQFKIYIFTLNEDLEQQDSKKKDKSYEQFINYYNNEIEFHKDLYKKVDEIRYNDIYNIKNDWINSKLVIETYGSKHSFDLSGVFELYLINFYLTNIDINGYEKKLSKNRKKKSTMPIEKINEDDDF
jgi:hypothetical protein